MESDDWDSLLCESRYHTFEANQVSIHCLQIPGRWNFFPLWWVIYTWEQRGLYTSSSAAISPYFNSCSFQHYRRLDFQSFFIHFVSIYIVHIIKQATRQRTLYTIKHNPPTFHIYSIKQAARFSISSWPTFTSCFHITATHTHIRSLRSMLPADHTAHSCYFANATRAGSSASCPEGS